LKGESNASGTGSEMTKVKSIAEFEAEAIWVGECLIHLRKGGRRLSRQIYQMRHNVTLPRIVFVCHTCYHGSCINDAHHFLGTCKENTQDAQRKGLLKKSPEECARLSKRNLGNKYGQGHSPTEQQRQAIREKLMGHEVTPLTRLILSLANSGRKQTPEHIAKRMAARRKNASSSRG